MKETTHELERQELLAECHSLVAVIGQHQYAVKLLRAARDGLRLYVGYKSRRMRSQVVR